MSEPTQPGAAADKLVWARSENIAIPSVARDDRLAMRRADWNRIKRCISQCKQPSDTMQIIYSILAGFSGSAALTLITLIFTEKKPAWAIPMFICLTIFSAVSAVALWKSDQQSGNKFVIQLSAIREDMADIETQFDPVPAISVAVESLVDTPTTDRTVTT
jgi:hypothetical protein